MIVPADPVLAVLLIQNYPVLSNGYGRTSMPNSLDRARRRSDSVIPPPFVTHKNGIGLYQLQIGLMIRLRRSRSTLEIVRFDR